MNNLYNMYKEEGKYHTWTSGFEANSEDDNPYSDQTDEDLYKVWKQGYRARKKAGKVEVLLAAESLSETVSVALTSSRSASPVHLVSTEDLEKELFKRKHLELQDLKEALAIINKKINKIESLLND